jgi:glycosyltransferase involved in cell wall biosynthesis
MEIDRSRRIGFVTGFQVADTPEGLLAEPGMGRVLNALHALYPDMWVMAPVPLVAGDWKQGSPQLLTVPPDRFRPLPHMPTFATGVRHIGETRKALRAFEAERDLLVIQWPFQVPQALLRPKTPRVYQVVADVREMAKKSSQYSGPTRVPAIAYAAVVDAIQRHLARGPEARLVTNGEVLLAGLGGRGRAVISSSLSEAELGSVRRVRPEGPPYRVLYAGYVRHGKGLDLLADAIPRLRRSGLDVELEIVGPGEPEDLGAATSEAIRSLEREGIVRLAGKRTFGPELFQHYADADVLALPSRTEGTPRVLVEARAFSCPVVATRVGGIPSSVSDGVDGILIPPDDVDALTGALRAVLTDADLRARLIEAGLAGAHDRTLESFSLVLAGQVEALFEADHPPASLRR